MDAPAPELAVRCRQLTNELEVTREEHRRNLALNLELVADLDRLQAGLEARIGERTAELQSSNRRLEEEVRERRKVQAELKLALDKAQAASRAKSDFLANMSHEIRTPMNGIVGMASLLAETDLSAEQRRHLEAIQTSTHFLLGIINDILDYSKIEAGKLEIADEAFSPRDVVEGVLNMLTPKARDKGVALVCAVAPDVPACARGDSGRLRQVLMNLVGNAVKFTERGEVAIRVSPAEEPRTLNPPSSILLRISVRDTGIGIAPEMQGLLFEPFTQADNSTTRRFGGTGLGLAISRQLVALMGGTIGLKSPPEPGAPGSLFWFTLPLRPVAEGLTAKGRGAPPAGGAGSPEERFRGLRVLVAEDNAINRQVAMAMLGRLGMTVEVVFNGAEAVAAVGTKAYDLILMDCQMPEMDGYEATRRIRARGMVNSERSTVGSRVPIIAMTANAMKGDREKCLAAGMDDYLAKPVERPALVETLARVLCRPCGSPGSTSVPAVEPTAAASAPAPAPAFDRQGALAKLGGDEALLAQVTALFVDQLGPAVERIGGAVLQGNVSDVSFHAHSLKGTAGRIGALALRDIAQRIELAARDGDMAPARASLEALRQAHEAFLAALDAAVAPPPDQVEGRETAGDAGGHSNRGET